MKVALLVVCFVAFVVAQTSMCPPEKCSALNSNCPSSTSCKNVFEGTSYPADYRCICISGYVSSCGRNNTSNAGAYTCTLVNTTNPNACGSFSTGCPSDMYCWNATKCVCRVSGYVYDNSLSRCRVECSSAYNTYYNSTYDKCVCKDGYVAVTDNTTTLRCVSPSVKTCSYITCPNNSYCVDSSSGPSCKYGCGYGFQCPTTGNYECKDSSTGPSCKCASGYGGSSCQYKSCWTLEGSTELGCWYPDGHADCVLDSSSSTGYCVCQSGWYGEQCNQNKTDCSNTVSYTYKCGNNTESDGCRCHCKAGYSPASSAPSTGNWADYVLNCVSACDDSVNPCTGNYKCAVVNGTAKCYCPYPDFGSAACEKPRCGSDADCQKKRPNSYCVNSTQSTVPPYCQCKPNYYGEYCNITATCTATNCNATANKVCTNEGRCTCNPLFSGENCDILLNKTQSNCKEYALYVTVNITFPTIEITAETVQLKIAEVIKIDISVIKVSGPYNTTVSISKKLFNVTLCSDANIDSNKSSSAYTAAVASGNIGGLTVSDSAGQNVSSGSGTTASDTESPAEKVVASLFLLFAMLVLAF